MIYLSDFQLLRPPHESTQEHLLQWILEAHVQAEQLKGSSPEALEVFKTSMQERMQRVACKPTHIAKRGHILPDYLHKDWSRMELFATEQNPNGAGLGARMRHYDAHVDLVFDHFYQAEPTAPDEMIHVTCTGYMAPSGAQKLIAKKGWGQETTPTHAYHMGCYASIPAIRMAKHSLLANPGAQRIDIVHTELCSLHPNPSAHAIDQLISQSLFADGFIKYSARSQGSYRNNLKNREIGKEAPQNFDSERAGLAERLRRHEKVRGDLRSAEQVSESELAPKGGASETQNYEAKPTPPKTDSSGYFGISPRIALLATKEELIADSAYAMTWNLTDWGFEMFLAKEIPVLIARSLKGYLHRLGQGQRLEEALFAMHPGGPKIISHVQQILALADWQVAHSVAVLRDFGNMSSATLPHIWKAILEDESVPSNTPIISLAFGPGLTICGSLMEKQCG